MSVEAIEELVDWLMGARLAQQGAWPKEKAATFPSLTVTAEVVASLVAGLPRIAGTTREQPVRGAIAGGAKFIEDTLLAREDVNLDLANLASSLVALSAAYGSGVAVNTQAVVRGVESMLRFAAAAGSWKPVTDGSAPATTFAAFLAYRAISRVLACRSAASVLTSTTHDRLVMERNRTKGYMRSVAFSPDGVFVDVRDEISRGDTAGITALGLHHLVDAISDESPEVVALDPGVQACVAYLLKNEATVVERWTCKLQASGYELCYLPLLLQALGRLCSARFDQVQSPALSLLHRLAHHTLGSSATLRDGNGAVLFWKRSVGDRGPANVWVAAHFLSGVAGLRSDEKDLAVISKLETVVQAQKTEIVRLTNQLSTANAERRDSTPPDFFRFTGPGPAYRDLGSLAPGVMYSFLFLVAALVVGAAWGRSTLIAFAASAVLIGIFVVLLRPMQRKLFGRSAPDKAAETVYLVFAMGVLVGGVFGLKPLATYLAAKEAEVAAKANPAATVNPEQPSVKPNPATTVQPQQPSAASSTSARP